MYKSLCLFSAGPGEGGREEEAITLSLPPPVNGGRVKECTNMFIWIETRKFGRSIFSSYLLGDEAT